MSSWWRKPWWSVRLALEDGEGGPISLAMQSILNDSLRYLSVSDGPYGDEGEPHVLTFEIEAPDVAEARARAQALVRAIRENAQLPVRDAQVVWVARLDSQPVSSFRFLDQATEALKSEQPEWAVIAAQTHLEVHVRVLALETAKAASSPLLDAVMGLQRLRQWAPHNPYLRPVLEAVYGIEMTECESWTAYEAHVARRNAIVHGGQPIDEIEARESVEAVLGVWEWLNGVANEHSGPPKSPSSK